jgi:protein TonB
MASGSASSGPKNDLTTRLSISTAGEFRPLAAMPTRREARLILIALCAASLLHASAILGVLIDWPDSGRPIERRDIPVDLVFEPPPEIEEKMESAPIDERESGGDPNLQPGRPADLAPHAEAPSETSVAKPAEALGPLPEPAPVNPMADFAPPMKKPDPPAPPDPPKPAETVPALPQPAPPVQTAKAEPRKPSRLSMIGQGGGDVYLNQLHDLIEAQRSYPDIGNPMRLSGVAIFELRLTRDGQLANVILLRSTGAGPLDEEGRKIIRRAAPFPPVPLEIRSNLPGNLLGLRLDLPIHP